MKKVGLAFMMVCFFALLIPNFATATSNEVSTPSTRAYVGYVRDTFKQIKYYKGGFSAAYDETYRYVNVRTATRLEPTLISKTVRNPNWAQKEYVYYYRENWRFT
ncbi:hypothetical protein ACYSNU_18710 [Enterococcus sp. LJL120]